MLPHHEMRGGLCRLTRFQSAVFLHPLENDSLNFLQQNNTADFILKRVLLPQRRAGCKRQRLGPPERGALHYAVRSANVEGLGEAHCCGAGVRALWPKALPEKRQLSPRASTSQRKELVLKAAWPGGFRDRK